MESEATVVKGRVIAAASRPRRVAGQRRHVGESGVSAGGGVGDSIRGSHVR
jgi:hypothetical protein